MTINHNRIWKKSSKSNFKTNLQGTHWIQCCRSHPRPPEQSHQVDWFPFSVMDFSLIGDHPATKILILCDAQRRTVTQMSRRTKSNRTKRSRKKTQKRHLWFSNVFWMYWLRSGWSNMQFNFGRSNLKLGFENSV